ncbi:butyrophilin subfamily 1 member A1-like [Rana temporaria]|uniref:butyrophilin subfamily 1 member A1-like n=1 Tax=Rana temporaria TaxID=8407 RepID=UPI001AAD43F6|nr:butyrophilin subfamily 1 member A1-like [Rana temporaria]
MGSVLTELVCIFSVIHTAGLANIPLSSSSNEVDAPVGGTAVLSCHLQTKTPKNVGAVLWKRTVGVEEIVVFFRNTNNQMMKQSKAYMGRATMSEQWLTQGEMTLTVKNITPNDAGEYSCWIKESSVSPLPEHKCCSMKLHVEQRKSGEPQQVMTVWSLYLLFLLLCLYLFYRWGSKKNQQLK